MKGLKKELFKNLQQQFVNLEKQVELLEKIDKALDKQLAIQSVGSTFVCNYCLEQVSTLPDDFGCQSCIDNYK